MRKTAIAIALVILLLFTFHADTRIVTANFAPWTVFLPEIIINSNGTVTPEGFIERSGNTYTLVRDVTNFSLSIERSNVVLDGGGHTLTVIKTNGTLDIMNTGLILYRVTNITVKDLQITGFH